MLFNSFEFLVFLPTVFILYWFLFNKQLKSQNILIVVASYLFYGWWDWRFLSLIILSTVVDYVIGLQIHKRPEASVRKLLLGISLLVNLGVLGFFKYYNFFIESWIEAWGQFGVTMHVNTVQIVLPVGISFYTFQTLSYTIDIYRRKLKPTTDFIGFTAFVSFFPQLVAGPIERASNLLDQFLKTRSFSYEKAADGTRQVLWGLFKKMVIADNCAIFVNDVFDNYHELPASRLVLGAILFAFQIYGDFSGYSDIAIGTARLFGFNLRRNFAYPYFSRDIAEFWRRWHISLSTWFRDYVYIPLGGSKGNKIQNLRNVLIIFLVSGLWHGANWTFVFWGFLNALYFIPLMIRNSNRAHLNVISEDRIFAKPTEVLQISLTFCLTCIGWIFFRSETIGDAFQYLVNIFDSSILTFPIELRMVPLLVLLIVFEWLQRSKEHALDVANWKSLNRKLAYSLVSILILVVSPAQKTIFIYFQF